LLLGWFTIINLRHYWIIRIYSSVVNGLHFILGIVTVLLFPFGHLLGLWGQWLRLIVNLHHW
jgi:hypothetical protein